MNFAIYILPVIFAVLFIYAIIKKIPAYDYFVSGSKNAFDLVISIMPYIVAIMLFTSLMNVSGVSLFLSKIFTPFFNFFGIPSELSELVILRPFSGNGSLAILKNIFQDYGPDSYIGRCAAVILGASDTVFYVVAVYFSTTNIKNIGYTTFICLFSSFVGTVFSCFICRII